MKRSCLGFVLLLAISFIVALSDTAFAAEKTYTFWPVDDAWVNEANPDTNYGNNTYLSLKDRSGLGEIYMKWSKNDLDALSGFPIASASLFLYQYQGTYSPGDDINLHKVTSDWNEGNIAWNSKSSYEVQTIGSLNIGNGNNVWREWPGLEKTVSFWAGGNNYGLVLENNKDGVSQELFARFYSFEYSNPEYRPHMKITTTPEPLGMILFGIGGGALYLARLKRKYRASQNSLRPNQRPSN